MNDDVYRNLLGILNGGVLDTLVALVENGPVWAGDLPSKSGRDMLVQSGLAIPTVARTKENGWGDGYTAVTFLGAELYKRYYGNSTTINEARMHRVATSVVRASHAIQLRVQDKLSVLPHCTNCVDPHICVNRKGCEAHAMINLWGDT